jgi:hypothetical protein
MGRLLFGLVPDFRNEIENCITHPEQFVGKIMPKGEGREIV